MTETREVLLIDFSNLFWTAWHSSGEDEVSQARTRTLQSIQRCMGGGNRIAAICCDAGRSFRKDLHPEYKANRPEKDHSSLAELERTKEKLRADGFLLWEVDGFEADDIIATATQAARARGLNVVIASADKDLLQLLDSGVRALRTHTWAEVGTEEVLTKFGVTPETLADWLALVGDKSDNVAGAPGIGPKNATNLLSKFRTLDALYIAIHEGQTVATPKIQQSLIESEDAVMLARRLVTLRYDAPINFDEIFERREPAKAQEQQQEIDMEADPQMTQQQEIDQQSRPEVDKMATQEMPIEKGLVRAVPFQSPTFELALEPVDLGVAFKLGKALFESRLYSRFPSAEAITAVIIRGREMGLPAMTALDTFHVIDGKPVPFAWLLISRAMAHRDCEYFQWIEADDQRATWETKSRKYGAPQRLTYTYEQAVRAQLPKSGAKGDNGWIKNPEDMLVKTCGVKLGRRVYPDAFLGLTSLEELGEI